MCLGQRDLDEGNLGMNNLRFELWASSFTPWRSNSRGVLRTIGYGGGTKCLRTLTTALL